MRHDRHRNARVCNLSAGGALDTTVLKFPCEGTHVDIAGLSEATAVMVGRVGAYDKLSAVPLLR